MAVVPNGPPKTFAPPGTPSLPLFTPEQVQQMNDAQISSSMLPFGRQAGPGVELPRLPAVFQHLLPGFDHVHALQEQRQRELEWRAAMESRMEQLGLQLRASQTENCRLREELNEVRRDSSRYGTPEEKPQMGWEVLEVGKFEDRVQKGQGQVAAVSQLVPPLEASIVKAKPSKDQKARARKSKSKEDGVVTQQVPRKEDGVATQQVPRKEDGVVTQQASNKEEGAETRQDLMQSPSRIQEESEDEQSSQSQDSEQDLGEERSQGARNKEGDPTMQVLLKIVDTMQVMQQSMLKSKEEIGEEPEVVRVSPQLPKLPEWCPESAPIDFNDWLTCLEVHMSDLSSNSQHWWEATMKVVSTWYAHHMTLTPIQRLSHVPELPDHLKQRKWSRLEKRAASLLMASIPETLREEVVASKAVSTHGIMSKAMLVYQPGGFGRTWSHLAGLGKTAGVGDYLNCNHSAAQVDQVEEKGLWNGGVNPRCFDPDEGPESSDEEAVDTSSRPQLQALIGAQLSLGRHGSHSGLRQQVQRAPLGWARADGPSGQKEGGCNRSGAKDQENGGDIEAGRKATVRWQTQWRAGVKKEALQILPHRDWLQKRTSVSIRTCTWWWTKVLGLWSQRPHGQ